MNRLAVILRNLMLLPMTAIGLGPIAASANEPNTLISVHVAEINNKNKPVQRTYSDSWSTFRLINEETGKKTSVTQRRKAKFLYLEPGTHCIYSTDFANFEILRIPNSVCFRVEEKGITNAGTWVIGIRASPPYMYALIIDMKENYDELEAFLEVFGSTPAVMTLPVERK